MGKISDSGYKNNNSHDDNNCPVCHGEHFRKCAIPGCSAAGTITESTRHGCVGEVRWYCNTHFFDRDYRHDGRRKQRELLADPVKQAFEEQLAVERKRQIEIGPAAYRERALKALKGFIHDTGRQTAVTPARRGHYGSAEVETWD
jgi:hypothetical protein